MSKIEADYQLIYEANSEIKEIAKCVDKTYKKVNAAHDILSLENVFTKAYEKKILQDIQSIQDQLCKQKQLLDNYGAILGTVADEYFEAETGSKSIAYSNGWQLPIFSGIIAGISGGIYTVYSFWEDLFGGSKSSSEISHCGSGHTVGIKEDGLIQENQKENDSVDISISGPITHINEDSKYPINRASECVPRVNNSTGERSAEAYSQVIADFDVENRERYQVYGSNTYCNIFVWDATKAMGCEIPHWYNPNTGEKMAVGASGAYEMSALRMTDWLENYGSPYGWKECSELDAINRANQGYPTVIAATNTNHVGMVVPQQNNDTGVMTAQAGATNHTYDTKNHGFYGCSVKYFYHE